MKKFMSVFVMAVILSVLAGCETGVKQSSGEVKQSSDEKAEKRVSNVNAVFTSDGLPQQKYLVGGGLIVEYYPPHDGVVYWVDEGNKRIFISQYVARGDSFEESIQLDEEEIKLIFSEEDLQNLKMGLYFVPADIVGNN